MERSAAASMVDVLTLIWQRVLQRQSISIEDDFFDLGGDPALATKLFLEIGQVCGRDVPPVIILHAPTIASLAAILEQTPAARLPTLVPLKAGLEGPPVFIAPGLGGNILDLLPLARHIQSSHPIFGMVARGVDGADKPFERVGDIAELYLDAITKLQSHGPYLLVGGSFGGLVMLEIAQRLSQRGEQIGLLAMLDAYPHIRFLSLSQRARLSGRRARNRISILARQPLREAISYVLDHIRARLQTSKYHDKRLRDRLTRGQSLSPAMLRLRNGDYLALANYRPRFYKGKIKFVKAERDSHFPDDAGAVWNHLASEVEVETVPGDHLNMITTHYGDLAAVISRFLQEALP